MPYYEYEDDIVHALIEAINALPNAKVIHHHRDLKLSGQMAIDVVLDIVLADQQLILVGELKREVFPRDVHHIMYQLHRGERDMSGSGREIIPFLAAESLSEGARDILKSEGIGYFDTGGSLFLPSKTAYILIDRPVPRKAKKTFGSVFEGQKARVLQIVFERRHDQLSVKEIAEQAGVAPSTVSTTLTELERRNWAVAEGSGPNKVRRLIDPGLLLDTWAQHLLKKGPPQLTRYYVPVGDAAELGRRLDAVCQRHEARYAVTGEVAAQIYAPYLSSISQLKCRVEPGRLQHEVLDALDARPVSEGWNLGMLEARSIDEIEIGERKGHLQLAPPLQIYLDLLQGSGRSEDMADHFRHERLGV